MDGENGEHYLTRFNFGFERLALAEACLLVLASIAPALFIDKPSLLAIFF
jgi:hypothetical protein